MQLETHKHGFGIVVAQAQHGGRGLPPIQYFCALRTYGFYVNMFPTLIGFR
jgi:hypothetical protein